MARMMQIGEVILGRYEVEDLLRFARPELPYPDPIARAVVAGQEGVSAACVRPAQAAICPPRDQHAPRTIGRKAAGIVVAARAELRDPELVLGLGGEGREGEQSQRD